jgi:hypothetical protein
MKENIRVNQIQILGVEEIIVKYVLFKINLRQNPDVNKNEKSNILHKFGKNYDLTGREGQKIRDVHDILRGEGYIIYKQPDLDPNKLTPQAAEANNNDFLILKAK